jgi:hypothetical protein
LAIVCRRPGAGGVSQELGEYNNYTTIKEKTTPNLRQSVIEKKLITNMCIA